MKATLTFVFRGLWMQAVILLYLFEASSVAFSFILPERHPKPPRSRRHLPRFLSDVSDEADEIFHWVIPEGESFGSLKKLQLRPLRNGGTRQSAELANVHNTCIVSTRAIGLNFADIFCILGLYSAANQIRGNAAFCPGMEFSGIVEEDNSGTFSIGDRVLGFTRFGAYSDCVHVPPHFLYPLPDNWSFIQGAGFLVQGLTAWHGLVEIGGMPLVRDAKTSSEPYVALIHSASGGVGLWAAEIATRRGAVVIGVVGSETKVKVFKDRILPLSPRSRAMVRGDEKTFGRRLAEVLFAVHNIIVPDEVPNKHILVRLREDGHGVDLVMESLGGQYFTHSFEALNRGGSLVTFGSTSYVGNWLRLIWRYLTRPKIDPGVLTSRNIRLAGFNLIYLTDKAGQLRQELRDFILCLTGLSDQNGQVAEFISLQNVTPPFIGDVFDFRTGAVEALEKLKSGTTVGKVVLDNDRKNCKICAQSDEIL